MASPNTQIVPSSSSNSTSTPTPTPYEVFLSFSGKDTRTSFTSHLYNALCRNGIRTFMDDPELRSGEVISSRLLQSIQESKINIVVLSENYASSTWCLDELVEILRCFKESGRLVIPVFYKIDPSVVRYQIKSFETAFKKHQIRFAAEIEKVKNWRDTLQEVANFSGYHVSGNRSEADIINEVVDRILHEVKPTTLEVATYPVALDSRIEGVTSLLNTSTGVTIIGIYGMGGIGKTTLAKAVFNQISLNFGGSSFLENVREVSGTVNGLVSLQQQLIDDVLKRKIYTVHNVSEGTASIKERICSIKVLIVLDDLDHPDQFESLFGPFVSGSVIIITTRKEDLLVTIGVDPRCRYMLEELGKAESQQLFYRHAFGDKTPSDRFIDLSKEILQHAGGLPLALKVFGSSLRNQPEAEWQRFIGQLEEVVHPDVLKKLIISFDTLVNPTLKEMFLDIACFFVGAYRHEIVPILESCYRFVDANIDSLKSRGLITFNEKNCFSMHDLLRDMGWEIARQNFPRDEPEKHSRLSDWQDIHNVLVNKKGTEAIKGIVHHYIQDDECEKVKFDTETFRRMPNLRLLKIYSVHLKGSFEQTFKDLRCLYWMYCPLESLPSDFFPEKLVILELWNSKIRTWKLTKEFKNLKILDLSDSSELTATPDFSRLPCLETINLSWCTKLEKVDTTIGSLVKLVSLNMEHCGRLRSLPDSVCDLRALESLNMSSCFGMKVFPDGSGRIGFLTKFNVSSLHILKLPIPVGRVSKLVNLKHLETLNLSSCNLEKVDILEELTSIRYLNLAYCSSVKRLPKLSNLKRLEMLKLAYCSSLREIEGLEKLISIRKLYLEGCNSLMAANILKESLFQICSEFGNKIEIYLGKGDNPNWISHKSLGSTEVQTNVSDKFSGFLLSFACDVYMEGPNFRVRHGKYGVTNCSYTIKNRAADLPCTIREHSPVCYDESGAVMVIIPRQDLIESCRRYDEDTIFEVTASCSYHIAKVSVGVHPLYKPDVEDMPVPL